MIGDNQAAGMNTADVITFYGCRNTNGVFSNFYPRSITIDGKSYPTTEHYFQAMKFSTTDDAWAEAIRVVNTPSEAARKGRSRSHPIRADWEQVKLDVMYTALTAKFTQHSDCKKVLLDTNNNILVEHTRNDAYWGDGANGDIIGNGKNALGQLLMRLRDQLRQN